MSKSVNANVLSVPTECLLVARRVQPESRNQSRDLVVATLGEVGVAGVSSIRPFEMQAVDLVTKDEYAQRKRASEPLGLWSVAKLEGRLNSFLAKDDALQASVYGVELGSAEYEESEDGSFRIGFTLTDEFRGQIAGERVQAIHEICNILELPKQDELRTWKFDEGPEAWLPVVHITADTPQAEDVADELSDALSIASIGQTIDFYDVRARSTIYDVEVVL